MVYNSEEVKDPSFIILEDDVLSKIVFKKSDGSTLVVPLADITDVESIKSALSGFYSSTSDLSAESSARAIFDATVTVILKAESFNPATVPGLVAWFSSDDLVGLNDGSALASWPDASGQNHPLVQPTGVKQPIVKSGSNGINGRPLVRFDGVDDNLSNVVAIAQPSMIFIAARTNSIAKAQFLVDGITSTDRQAIYINNDPSFYRFAMWSGFGEISTLIPPDTLPHVFRALFSSAASRLWVDGLQYLVGDVGMNALTGIMLGAFNDGVSPYFWDGDVYDILVFNRKVTDLEAWRIETYLQWRCGLPIIQAPLTGALTYESSID